MTTLTDITIRALGSDGFATGVTGVAVVVLLVLLFVLAERALLGAGTGDVRERSMQEMNVLIAPFLVMFMIFALARLLPIVL